MQSGSIARAAWAAPMSSGSKPNWVMIDAASLLAFASFPQKNIVGFTPPKSEVSHEGPLQQIFADQFGWPEMVEQVAAVYNGLPPEEREKAAIYGSNYGQAGAIDFFGDKFGLPKSISPHQSYFLWGPHDYTGESIIILGSSLKGVEGKCDSVEVLGEVTHPYVLPYEKYPIIHCRQTKKPLSEIWQSLKYWN